MPIRILALDLGRKRIGLAISDGLGITAQGLPTLDRRHLRADLGTVHHLAAEREVAAYLLGLPRSLRGEETRQAAWVRDFGERLRKRSRLPVVYWDERFTSVEAERVLRQEGGDRLSLKGKVDRLAAVLLLQSYLDAGCPGLSAGELAPALPHHPDSGSEDAGEEEETTGSATVFET